MIMPSNKTVNSKQTVYALASATRANYQADNEDNELVQEAGVSQETGFDEGRGEPLMHTLIHSNALIQYIVGKRKELRIFQARGRRGIGIHGILIIHYYWLVVIPVPVGQRSRRDQFRRTKVDARQDGRETFRCDTGGRQRHAP
jgi:hypothetical protein